MESIDRSSIIYFLSSTLTLHPPPSSQLLRFLEQAIDGDQKSPAAVAVANAVIGGERRFNDRPHADHAVSSNRPLGDLAETHQGHLRRIDHAENAFDSLLAEVGDGNRAVG